MERNENKMDMVRQFTISLRSLKNIITKLHILSLINLMELVSETNIGIKYRVWMKNWKLASVAASITRARTTDFSWSLISSSLRGTSSLKSLLALALWHL